MKTVSANLQTHLDLEVTTLAVLWKIVRQDLVELYFTNHDTALTFEGDIYEAQTGFSTTAIENDNNLGVNNLDVIGILASTQINEDEIRNGLFDYANIFVSVVNYESIADGSIAIQRGVLGEAILRDNNSFSIELRGMSQYFAGTIGDKYYPECGVDLGDAKCQVDVGALTVVDTVATVVDRTTFTLTTATNADNAFNLGVLTFTSGANIGRSLEVISWTLSTKTIVLYLPAGETIEVGDTVSVYPGCDKLLSTCRDVFDNVVNFRGFPHSPGDRFLFSIARR